MFDVYCGSFLQVTLLWHLCFHPWCVDWLNPSYVLECIEYTNEEYGQWRLNMCLSQLVQVFTFRWCFSDELLHLHVWPPPFKSQCFWSRQYICICSHRTWCTPSGGDRGRCDAAFFLNKAPENRKKRKGEVIWQLKSFISWQVKLQVFKSLNSEMDVVLAEVSVTISRCDE